MLATPTEMRRRLTAQSCYHSQDTISSPLNRKATSFDSSQGLFGFHVPAADLTSSSGAVGSSIQYGSFLAPPSNTGDYSFSSSMASVMASSIRSTPSPPCYPRGNPFNLLSHQDVTSEDTFYQEQLYRTVQ